MIILAIETSCDDTCVAIIEAEKRRYQRRKTQIKFNILSNIVSSQIEVHKKWGGVYPALAKREHQKNLPLVLRKALKKAKEPKIDLIAVTVGPGLEPCLWVGVNFAKDLAKKWNLPIVPVNHIEAHIMANFIGQNQKSKIKNQNENSKFKILLPAVCLVVSGGHTQLILMRDFGNYKILGETRDDAAGECFDKVARILGLGYPGGPAIAAEAKLAENCSPLASGEQFSATQLPRPMLNQKNYDFSFSGLKTAVLYNYKKYKKTEMAKEIQQAIIDVLIKKTIKAAKDYRAKTIILGGGVTANQELRKQFRQKIQKEKLGFKFQVPSSKLCTDNAVMAAIAGYFGKPKSWKKIKADANIRL